MSNDPRDLVIYYNDPIDSDNWAGLKAFNEIYGNGPHFDAIYILEPRQVSLGLKMTPEERDQCQALIKTHFPCRGSPFKVLMGGLLSRDDIDHFSPEEKKLLEFAVKPAYGPRKHATLHARLAAWDQATALADWSGTGTAEVSMYLDSLDGLENPVNLNVHFHDELWARTPSELEQFCQIMDKPKGERIGSLELWYEGCIAKMDTRDRVKVKDLDFDDLCGKIERADRVFFFGGASMSLLQRLGQTRFASKIHVSVQAGSFDLISNLFPNQFNIALNPEAARWVLKNNHQFATFSAVPSHTAQRVRYSLDGLARVGGRHLEKRMLGFNCREEAITIATDKDALKKQPPGKAASMPDLTAFLHAVGIFEMVASRARVDDRDGVILFTKTESSTDTEVEGDVTVYNAPEGDDLELSAEKVEEIFTNRRPLSF